MKTRLISLISVAIAGITIANAEILTVSEAVYVGLGLAMDTATSIEEYTVEGFVINAGQFNTMHMSQSWYMADDAATTASYFQAYNCYPIENGDTLKVLNGDKISITGKLKKIYNRGKDEYLIEIVNANASFISKVEGNHSVDKSIEEVTVNQALAIGNALTDKSSTEKRYKIKGYISAVDVKPSDAFSTQYGNQSLWIMDLPGNGKTNAEGAFYVYRGRPENEQALAEGAYVEFICSIGKYGSGDNAVVENSESNITIRILQLPLVVEAIADSSQGTVSFHRDSVYAGAYMHTLIATANYGYHFVQWNDGNTDNPRIIALTQDTTFTAEFAKNTYSVKTESANSERGTTKGDTTALYLDQIEISATPNYGYHFSHWNDGNTDNPRIITLRRDITFIAEFIKNTYTINTQCNASQGIISGDLQAEYLDLVELTATPNRGYQFVRWTDGNTENPRTIELTQDTTLEAIFDYLLEGKCGKDSALVWKLDTTTMALEITGKGALSENYTYGTFIESLTVGNEVTIIGYEAFEKFKDLKNIIIGTSVKVLEEQAFKGCTAIETITCYSQRPPTVNNRALEGLDYSTIIYVPADYLNTYVMHDTWGLYDVRPLGAKSTETTEVTVTPAENTVDVIWPAVSGAATYELVIKDKDGNVICTLIFNANGQLTQIAFGAPARDHSTQQTQGTGFAFTVTGLESGTGYDLTITSKDGSGSTLDSQTISFTTTGEPQAVENVPTNINGARKVFFNGQIFILRGDKVYTTTGQEVK